MINIHGIRLHFSICRSLDETSANVYQENLDLIDSLRSHKEQLDEYQRNKEQLTRLIARTGNEKELNEILIKEKVEQIQKNNHIIKQVGKYFCLLLI